MVSTLDFESKNPSSNLGRTLFFFVTFIKETLLQLYKGYTGNFGLLNFGQILFCEIIVDENVDKIMTLKTPQIIIMLKSPEIRMHI